MRTMHNIQNVKAMHGESTNYGKFAVTPCKQIIFVSVCGSEENRVSLDVPNTMLCSSSGGRVTFGY